MERGIGRHAANGGVESLPSGSMRRHFATSGHSLPLQCRTPAAGSMGTIPASVNLNFQCPPPKPGFYAGLQVTRLCLHQLRILRWEQGPRQP